jgi:hypothetical protein
VICWQRFEHRQPPPPRNRTATSGRRPSRLATPQHCRIKSDLPETENDRLLYDY